MFPCVKRADLMVQSLHLEGINGITVIEGAEMRQFWFQEDAEWKWRGVNGKLHLWRPPSSLHGVLDRSQNTVRTPELRKAFMSSIRNEKHNRRAI